MLLRRFARLVSRYRDSCGLRREFYFRDITGGYREREQTFLDDTSSPEATRAHIWLRRPIRWRIGSYIFAVLSLAFLSLTGFNLWLYKRQLVHDLPDAAALLVNLIGITWIACGVIAAVVLVIGNRLRNSTTANRSAP